MDESIDRARREIGEKLTDFRNCGERLSPLDIYKRMDSIRQLAAENGLTAVEGLAGCSAQLALLPGHRVAVRSCMEHMDEALESGSARDRTAILAAVAARLS